MKDFKGKIEEQLLIRFILAPISMVTSGVQSHDKKLGLPRRCAPRNQTVSHLVSNKSFKRFKP